MTHNKKIFVLSEIQSYLFKQHFPGAVRSVAIFISILLLTLYQNVTSRECVFSDTESTNPYKLHLHKFNGKGLTYDGSDSKFYYTVCSSTTNGDEGMIRVNDEPFAYWDNGKTKPYYDYDDSLAR